MVTGVQTCALPIFFMTLACFTRRAARDAGIPPRNDFELWVDERFSNKFMSNRFQNMVIGG